MQARYGWTLILALFLAIIVWDVAAAINGGETVTNSFRCRIAETNWRWPVLLLAVFVLIHLFLPLRLSRYDPLDRLYHWVNGDPPSSIPIECPDDTPDF